MPATTISSGYATLVVLSDANYNPVYVTSQLRDGLYGDSTTNWTVINTGTITGGADQTVGVSLAAGGTVSNQSGGVVSGSAGGVAMQGSYGSVVNAGYIAADAGWAVSLAAGGAVTNQSGGIVSGSVGAVYVGGAAGTVTNLGTLTSPGTYGVLLTGGGTVFNGVAGPTVSSATIYGMGFGVYVDGAAGTVFNYGTISTGTCGCSTYDAVYLRAGGSVTNAASASILGYSFGVFIRGGAGTVVNAGSIGASSAFPLSAAVYLRDGGSVENQATGQIEGVNAGVVAYGQATLTNFGTVTAAGRLGVAFLDGGTIINGDAANTSATIYGDGIGLMMTYGGSITNFGTIAGGTCGCYPFGGAYLSGGGSITNAANATIAGYGYGVGLTGSSSITIANAGTITGIHHGLSASVATYGATVSNSGLIEATATDGVAVYFATTTNLLVINPGAGFIGTVVGHSGDTIELASAISGGTIDGLGSSFSGFGTITIDVGATWTLTGNDTLTGTLINSGTLNGAALTLNNGYLLNEASGRIDVFSIDGVAGGAPDTVTNRGTITNATGSAVYFATTGNVTNATGALIEGSFGGVKLRGPDATVSNLGQITSTSGFTQYGIYLRNGGVVTNGQKGSGTSTAAIQGYYGIAFHSVEYFDKHGTLTNYGGVIGTGSFGSGAFLFNGGTVVNGASGAADALISGGRFGVGSGADASVDNFATIAASTSIGGAYGVFIQGAGSVRNLGAASLIQGYAGVEISLDGTVTNAGTIASTQGSAGIAVQFIGGNARLIVDPGATFLGSVVGGSGGTNTLQLASAANAGTLSGLGTQFLGFGTIVEDAGATWTLTGDNTIGLGATFTVLAGATVTNTGALQNDGTIFLDPSTLIAGDLMGTGFVTIDTGSTLEVQGAIAAGETIAFIGGASYAHFDSPAKVAGSVSNLDLGDAIDLKGVDQSSIGYDGSVLSFTGGSFPLSLAADVSLQVTGSGDGALLSALCFCKDTYILTPSGERRVQDLAVGDPVTTHRGAVRPIVWIGVGKVLATRGRRNAATPVIVRKDALADNVPTRDLRVTKGHALQLDDVLIPVEFLVNHRSIQWDDRAQEVELYHIELPTHDVLVANGAPAESYRDDGNRWLFQNARDDAPLVRHPPCAPILTGGARVDEAWRWLLQRAGARPGVPLTDDPDLHLLVDGVRVDASRVQDDRHVFHLARRPDSLCIVSRAAAPQELGLARDPRLLGVALRRIIAARGEQQCVIEAAESALEQGFHAFEPANGLRWTMGDAIIPLELLPDWSGKFAITLQLGAAARYLDEGEALLAA